MACVLKEREPLVETLARMEETCDTYPAKVYFPVQMIMRRLQ